MSQGVENDIDTVVRDVTSNVLASVGPLVRLAGKASLATGQSPQLPETNPDSDSVLEVGYRECSYLFPPGVTVCGLMIDPAMKLGVTT